MTRPLKVGAVMYDPKVSVIWEIIRDFFDAQGAPIDVAFYPTYEAQNDALLSGAPMSVTPQGSRRNIAVMQAATLSAADGGRPVVPPA